MCGVITRSYFSLVISQLCSMIVCLISKLSNIGWVTYRIGDIRFRMTDPIFGLVIFNA